VATVPPTAALCNACFGHRSPVAFAWCLAAHQVGAAMAAAGAGAIREHAGSYDAAFWAAGALCVVTGFAVLRIRTAPSPPRLARVPSLSLRRLLW